jgi:hypothetical protein
LQLQHTTEQWRLFNDSSKVRLKAVLLYERNGFPSTLLAHGIHRKEMYETETSGFATKMRYEEHGRIYELT